MFRRLASETAIYGLSSVVGRVLNFALTPFYTEQFLPESFGILSYYFAAIAFFNVFLIFGMETTYFRYTEEHDESSERVYQQACFWVISLVGGLWILSLPWYGQIAGLTEYPDRPLLPLYALLIVGIDALAALPLARLRRLGKAKRFAFINITNIGVTLLLNLVFIFYLDLDIEWVFVANLIASTLRLGLSLPKNLPGGLRPEGKLLRPMLAYAVFVMISGLAGMMNETLDRLLLPELWPDGAMFLGEPRSGTELNGIYSAGYKLGIFIALVTQAFRYAAEPFFFRHAADKDSPQSFARVFHYFILACLAGFLLIGSFVKEIMAFDFLGVFGDSTTFIDRRYWESATIVPIILMAYVLSAAYVNLSIWFKITKQTRFALLFTGVGALVTVVLNVLLIPRMGFFGSAWATLASYATMCVLCYFIGRRYYPIPYPVGRLLLYTAILVAAFFLNRDIGWSDGYGLAGFLKFLVCLGALGAVALIERWRPLDFGRNNLR